MYASYTPYRQTNHAFLKFDPYGFNRAHSFASSTTNHLIAPKIYYY